ncbi:MAG TPA: zf-HC2 domain-containing protein [Burkholderiales bacterium]|nr:zf-HC2 domain-containing protein [Burkholderiales bacterium]
MNISCKEASRLMSQAQDRELSLGERASLKFHLVLCRGCRAFKGQLELLRRAMRELSAGRN